MHLAVALALAGALAAGSPRDTVPADAFADPGARQLVARARARHQGEESAIHRYQALARSRLSIGVTALRRERLFYRCESAVRLDWRRGETAVVEVLGAREVSPLFSRKIEAEDDDCVGSLFHPMEDRLAAPWGGMIGAGKPAFIRHPLTAGSEAHYRFATGDTTVVRLPGGEPIRLVELRVIPRRPDPRLVSGSLWLDQASDAVVRAVLRMSRPFELGRDGGDGDSEQVERVLGDVRAEMRYMTVEYALWNGRFWLPRLVAIEGEGRAGALGRFPLRMEQTYSEYQIEADSTGAPVELARDPGPQTQCDETVQVVIGAGGGVNRSGKSPDSIPPAVEAPPGLKALTGCQCHGGRCFRVTRLVSTDSTAAVRSEHLPPSIFSEGEAVVSSVDMERLLEQVKRSAPVPWQVPRPEFSWAGRNVSLLRYNRVEGLSAGARVRADLGRVTAEGTARVGIADRSPNVQLEVTRAGPFSTHRAALYRRLETAGENQRALGLGNSLSALLLGRDDGEYFRTLGAELARAPAVGGEGLQWRLFAERQSAAGRNTDFSLAHALGGSGFRDNIEAQTANQAGAELLLRAARGLDPAGWRGRVAAGVELSTGTFSFARPSLTLGGAAPLPGSWVGALEVAGGATLGDAPTQSLWYLGGPATVRGYPGGALRGAWFWRVRAEAGTSAPGARLVGFTDAGWAGAREQLTLGPALLSVGAGVGVLDGLIRLDVSRALRGDAGWRLDLYLDAAL